MKRLLLLLIVGTACLGQQRADRTPTTDERRSISAQYKFAACQIDLGLIAEENQALKTALADKDKIIAELSASKEPK